MNEPIQIYDPRLITQDEGPWIVFSNQKGFIGDLIDWKTNLPGIPPTDHAMLSRIQAKFVCQNFTGYREIPMDPYLIKGGELAFVKLVNTNPDFVKSFNTSVDARLAGPTWTKWYDFIGIFGQAINCPWIHTPGLMYCSVDVIRHLVNACPKLPKADQLIINNIPPETNPELFRKITIDNPGTFNLKYTWDSETGIII